MNQPSNVSREEWLKVLTKGLVTLPKSWREELNITDGSIIKAKKVENKIIIEAVDKSVPYRLYSRSELNQFLKDDVLPNTLLKKISKKVRTTK